MDSGEKPLTKDQSEPTARQSFQVHGIVVELQQDAVSGKWSFYLEGAEWPGWESYDEAAAEAQRIIALMYGRLHTGDRRR